MRKTFWLIVLTIILTICACAPPGTASPSLSNTPAFTVMPTVTTLPIPESLNNVAVQKVYIADKYLINIPDNFVVQELSSRITTEPTYNFES